MQEYKTYHDSENRFYLQTMVYFCEANDSKQLSLYDLLKLTSDAAVEDYNQRGLGRDFLTENNFAVLVSRLSFRFHRMPRENEHILLRTWEEKPEALQLVRAYEIESMDEKSSGEKLVSGFSSWIVVNPETRRIVPTKMFNVREPSVLSEEHDCLKYGKIQIPESMELMDERVIKFSDIDGNGHTNNARYGAFVADALPHELRHTMIKDFRLNYAKEAKLGQKMQIFGKMDSVNKKLTLVGKTETDVSFEAELFW